MKFTKVEYNDRQTAMLNALQYHFVATVGIVTEQVFEQRMASDPSLDRGSLVLSQLAQAMQVSVLYVMGMISDDIPAKDLQDCYADWYDITMAMMKTFMQDKFGDRANFLDEH